MSAADCLPFATTYFLYDAVAAVSGSVKANMGVDNEQLGFVFSSYSIVRSCVLSCAARIMDALGFFHAFLMMSIK